MNNDIIIRPHVVDVLRDTLRDNPTIGIVGPTGSRLGGPQDWGSHNPGIKHPSGHTKERIAALPLTRTTYIAFAIGMISAAAWKEVGPLDDRLPLSADDHDYCIRIKENGYSVYVNNNAYVEHAGHASGASPNWNKWGKISWDWFNKKWAGYYANEEEAIKCHWGGVYHPGWDVGTGWLSPREQEPIYKVRQDLAKEAANG
jgi:GT2 family glycosyltransferase